jgi:hypothetical protein
MAITPNCRSSGNVSEMIITAEGYIGPRNIPINENAIALRVRFGINQMVSWRARHIQVLILARFESREVGGEKAGSEGDILDLNGE